MAVLRDIVAQPSRVVALGSYQGEDFIDLLIRLIPESQGGLRKALLTCLMCYQDPRTADYLAQVFATSRDAATVLHLGERLTLDKGIDFFRPFLWHEQGAQALAAARVCRAAPALEPRELLRVALLLEGEEHPLPELGQANLEVWLAELAGPHRCKTRQLAEGLGLEALQLWPGWHALPEVEKGWLVGLTERLDPQRARSEIQRLLVAGEVSLAVAQAACRLGLSLPAELLEHPLPEIRAAAIGSGLADASLARFLCASLPETLAATRRLPPEALVELLSDPRWQVRSEAVNRLHGCQPRPLAAVQALVGSEHLPQRVAAVELLRRWGETQWLEEWARAGPGASACQEAATATKEDVP